jgi:hypothetical protein
VVPPVKAASKAKVKPGNVVSKQEELHMMMKKIRKIKRAKKVSKAVEVKDTVLLPADNPAKVVQVKEEASPVKVPAQAVVQDKAVRAAAVPVHKVQEVPARRALKRVPDKKAYE